ncbi:MAG TPA: hypothetical protein PLU71_01145 [Candidatus Dependentiae bacterium]|nr:hypothetical protein [Candidatus Dependentiae bacterium]HRQ62436.1 hypothetical protein [Candidatus Dependentiae bacterium]
MKQRIKLIFITLWILLVPIGLDSRSPLRIQESWLPKITVCWADKPKKTYTLKHASLEAYPLFEVFNKEHFDTHKIPQTVIPLRSNTTESIKSVDGRILSDLLEELLIEIQKKKRHFKHFNVLQRKNWNRRHRSGLLVLKFKDYPFVVKLFSENPKTFVNYWNKGFEPIFFLYMGHGANRHISGLTRIKNKELVEQRLSMHPHWSSIVRIPRKWYWQPTNSRWIQLTGTHLNDTDQTLTTQLPSMYAIIADAEKTDDTLEVSQEQKKRMVMKLCSQLDLTIDPHYDNFVFQQDEKTGDVQIVLIDTEYFPIIVGIRDKKTFKTYTEWYLYLTGKFVNDAFFRTKDQRKLARFDAHNLKIPITS